MLVRSVGADLVEAAVDEEPSHRRSDRPPPQRTRHEGRHHGHLGVRGDGNVVHAIQSHHFFNDIDLIGHVHPPCWRRDGASRRIHRIDIASDAPTHTDDGVILDLDAVDGPHGGKAHSESGSGKGQRIGVHAIRRRTAGEFGNELRGTVQGPLHAVDINAAFKAI
jgi:hypothetical protein